MTNSIKNYLKGAITVFAICLIGTVSAAPNGNGDEKEKEKKEVKTEKSLQSTQWFEFRNNLNDGDTSNPLNYTLTPNAGQNPPSCPTGDDQVCAVHTLPDEDNPDVPDLSSSSIVETRMKSE